MLSSDDTTQPTGPFERASRAFKRRNSASERRQNILHQKHTDTLPQISNEPPNGKIAWRQLIQLREENKRLRWELGELDREIETLHGTRQQEIEQYENHLQEMSEEQERLRESHYQLERRYQELYHDFQSTVEKEVENMVTQAARTIELTPGDVPVVLNDVMKTVELHVRQLEDKNTAEALYLMRQAQRKAKQMEQELVQERQQMALERQNLHNLQQRARDQAELRKTVVEKRLRAQYTLSLIGITSGLLLLLPILQIFLLSSWHVRLLPLAYLLLFAPVIVGILLATFFYRGRSSSATAAKASEKKPAQKK